ncbi:hypothetical protein C8A01DRAFT_31436 [Parachaetomium inaequale]|uniref:SUZ-C domain-containing protein n=1 Tax=Parachaetomium inaequale TaxID=2588326 RepID=A0AAN6PNT7_9PEZI|nr:hypothetical protein C8A01DRAFT_31436 [Parachaetomium inaequale]
MAKFNSSNLKLEPIRQPRGPNSSGPAGFVARQRPLHQRPLYQPPQSPYQWKSRLLTPSSKPAEVWLGQILDAVIVGRRAGVPSLLPSPPPPPPSPMASPPSLPSPPTPPSPLSPPPTARAPERQKEAAGGVLVVINGRPTTLLVRPRAK